MPVKIETVLHEASSASKTWALGPNTQPPNISYVIPSQPKAALDDSMSIRTLVKFPADVGTHASVG